MFTWRVSQKKINLSHKISKKNFLSVKLLLYRLFIIVGSMKKFLSLKIYGGKIFEFFCFSYFDKKYA